MGISGLILLLLAGVAALTRPFWEGSSAEWLVAGILILLAGIPHGSLDHVIAGQSARGSRLVRFLLLYVGSVLLYLAAWLLMPGWSLVFFLLITAWHFGESDLHSLGISTRHPVLLFLYGLCVTVWLLWQHPADLAQWTQVITHDSHLMQSVVAALAKVPVLVFYGAAALVLLVAGSFRRDLLLKRLVFLVFLYLLSHTSLLIGFVLYFAGWHSVNALIHLRDLVFRQSGLRTMLFLGLPFFLGALALLAGIAYFSEVRWLERNGLPALFVLLSVLTLPHMTEMHRLYSGKKE